MKRATLLIALLFAGCSERLHGSLDEREANEMLAALVAGGVDAEKSREPGRGGRFEVRVPARELGRALVLLEAEGLPREQGPTLDSLLGERGLVPSELEEEAKLVAVMQAQLVETLRRIDGVIDARVHLALPRRPGLFEIEPPRPRGAVFLKTRGAPTYDEASVRALVAGGVQGLEAEAVEVVTVQAAKGPESSASALARVGPFEVEARSALPLRITLTLCVISLFSLLGALLTLAIRSRRNLRRGTPH